MIAEAGGADKRGREAKRISICYHTIPETRGGTKHLASNSYADAYPEIRFRPSSHNWWAWLKGTPAECIHLDRESTWMATLLPDTLYLRGKSEKQREPARPEVSVCRECLVSILEGELEAFEGRVVGFEPDPEGLTQYFFVAAQDFEAAGLMPEVASAINQRLGQTREECTACTHRAKWLWLSRGDVGSLDEVDRIREAAGEWLCARHGAHKLISAFERIAEANIFFMNLPYGETGAYVWI